MNESKVLSTKQYRSYSIETIERADHVSFRVFKSGEADGDTDACWRDSWKECITYIDAQEAKIKRSTRAALDLKCITRDGSLATIIGINARLGTVIARSKDNKAIKSGEYDHIYFYPQVDFVDRAIEKYNQHRVMAENILGMLSKHFTIPNGWRLNDTDEKFDAAIEQLKKSYADALAYGETIKLESVEDMAAEYIRTKVPLKR